MIRLLPQREQSTPIKCELCDYGLSETSGEKHIYGALSYVWGSGLNSQSITLNDCAFSVTENLHAALWHLRDRQLERLLWVDAIYIGRVIVWLGPLDEHGEEALQNIRLLAQVGARARGGHGATPSQSLAVECSDRCVVLLRRDWFRRMWILREVGVARSVVVMCGSVRRDGHAFCEGLAQLELSVDV